MHPNIAPRSAVLKEGEKRHMPKWLGARLLQMALLCSSFYLLIAICATPTSKLALSIASVAKSNITHPVGDGFGDSYGASFDSASSSREDQVARDLADSSLPTFPYDSADSAASSDLAPPGSTDFVIRIGVWTACAYPADEDVGGPNCVCTNKFYKGQTNALKTTPIDSGIVGVELSLFDGFRSGLTLVLDTIDQLSGLGETMVAIPIATAFTGVLVLYELLSFCSYYRPRCWRPHTIRDTVLTNHSIGLIIAALCLMTTVIAWTFAAIVSMSTVSL